MMRVVHSALRVVLTGIALACCAPTAQAAAHVAAPALHTATHGHHRTHHHAVRVHVAHASTLRDAPGALPHSRHGRAPAHQHNRKAALPASFHMQRHGSGSHARHGGAAFAGIAVYAHDARRDRLPSGLDAEFCPGMSLTLAGRAPPRAGPHVDLVPAHFPQRHVTPRRADPAPIPGAPIAFQFPFEAAPAEPDAPLRARRSPAPAAPAGFAPPFRVSPEQPLGRSRVGRPEGATPRRTMPSTRGLS